MALNRNLFRNIRSQMNQYEATTGRKVSQQTMQAMLEAELAAQYARASEDARFELSKKEQERLEKSDVERLALDKRRLEAEQGLARERINLERESGQKTEERLSEQIKAEKRAAAISGATQLASTGFQGYSAYKWWTAPKPGTPGTGTNPPSAGGATISDKIRSGVESARSLFRGTESPTSPIAKSSSPSSTIDTGVPSAPSPQSSMIGGGAYTPEPTGASTMAGNGPAVNMPSLSSSSAGQISAVSPAAFAPIPSSGTSFYTGSSGITTAYQGATAPGGGVVAMPTSTTAAPSAGGASLSQAAGPAAAAATAIGTGVESMRSAQGKTWGESRTVADKTAKVATQVTPWNDESKAGMVANVLTVPISATVGAIKMVENVIKPITGGRVICTELVRQGHMEPWLLELDIKSCEKFIDADTYKGYRAWADWVVDKMKAKPWWVVWIAKPLALAWSYESAHKVDPQVKGSLLGKFLRLVGIPVCRFIGKRCE